MSTPDVVLDMAQKAELKTEVKESELYRVSLDFSVFQMPMKGNKPIQGRIYGRGGLAFEANTEHVVSKEKLNDLKITVPIKRQGDKVQKVFDPNLKIIPIKEGSL